MSEGRGRVWAIRRGEPGYPAAMLDLGGDAPDRLFGCGSRTAIEGHELGHTVTIVGSRRASSYGLGVAEELGRLLAAAGLVVVSGMARGIDAAAHRGALAGGGTTLAVLGSGADVAYPASQRRLYCDILGSGAAISEAPPGQRPGPGAFPKRNRLMAALGAITVVVEAAQPSGSLITARQALDLGRQVGAIPGPVTSRVSEGTNGLIVDGAAPLRGAQDVLDRLLGVGIEQVGRCGPPLDPDLAGVAEAVELGSSTCDAVAVALGAAPREVAVALARLELLGYLRADAAGRYARSALILPGGEEASP
ncbi:MAG: DNA-processing protein DprA [Actinomycetota bacterium]